MTVSKEVRREVINCFKLFNGCHSIGKFEKRMNKLGFKIDKSSKKHLSMKYKDCPIKIILACTPSDYRANMNNAHRTIRLIEQYYNEQQTL